MSDETLGQLNSQPNNNIPPQQNIPNQSVSKKTPFWIWIIIVVVILAIAGGIYWYFTNKISTINDTTYTTADQSSTEVPAMPTEPNQ